MEPINKQTVKSASKFVTIGLLVGLLIGAFIAYGQSPSSTFTISSGVYPGAPSYTVWTEGGEFFAKDANGLLAFSGSSASTVSQATIDAVGWNPRTVYFQSGTYPLNTQLVAKCNLLGEGWATVFTWNSAGYAIKINDGGVFRGYTTLSNFKIEVGSSATGGIQLTDNIHYIRLDHLWITGTAYPNVGINLDGTTGGCYWNILSNIRINDCSVGIYLTNGANANFMSNIIVRAPLASGVGFDLESGDTNHLTNCHVEGIANGIIGFKIVSSNNIITYPTMELTGTTTIGFSIGGDYNQISECVIQAASTYFVDGGDYNIWKGRYFENGGTANFASNTTTTFNHGFIGTPTRVWASFNSTAVDGWTWTATATNITITVTPSGTYTVYWDAKYEP